MQTGNISAAVWDRCFGHRVITSDGRRLSRDSFWKDHSGAPYEVIRPVGGKYDLSPEMIAAEAVNGSFLKTVNEPGRSGTGLKDRTIPGPSRLSVRFLLTRDTTEEILQERMERITQFCKRSKICIVSADAAVSDAVSRDVLTAAAWTEQPEPEEIRKSVSGQKENAVPEGFAVCLAGCTGDAGISILANAQKELLKERFPAAFVEHAAKFGKNLLCRDLVSGKAGRIRSLPVGEGGIFAALWYFCRLWKTGVRIDPRKIPIHQETIEICEYLGIHPYQLYTCQAVLFAAHPDEVWPEAVRIGETIRGPACILEQGEEVRYLEKPQPDGLLHYSNTTQTSIKNRRDHERADFGISGKEQ